MQNNTNTPLTEYNSYLRRKYLVLLIMTALTLALVMASLMAGSVNMSLREIILALLTNTGSQTETIIRNIRMPRAAAALAVGSGLAVCGCIMQSVLRNPLASASTLGVSQGASFGAALSIVCFGAGTQLNTGSGSTASLQITDPVMVTVFAFAGGMATTIMVLALTLLKNAGPQVLVLAGVAISSMFSGATTLIQYFADDVMVATVVYWTFGNLGRAGWREIMLISVISALGIIWFFINRWNYNSLEGGADTARSLGVSVDILVPASMAVCALLSSVSVAFVGCINFIGLIASHIMRRFVGNDYRFLIPCSALAGAILLLAADIVCRTVAAPVVLPIGALTSFVGGPLFLFLIMKGGRLSW